MAIQAKLKHEKKLEKRKKAKARDAAEKRALELGEELPLKEIPQTIENNFLAVGAISNILKKFQTQNILGVKSNFPFWKSGENEYKNRAYFKKNLRPSSAAFFFILFHDFTTKAPCSSVKPPMPSNLVTSKEAELRCSWYSLRGTQSFEFDLRFGIEWCLVQSWVDFICTKQNKEM